MANRTEKQLGKLGETTLHLWAHQSLLTVTRVVEDEQGWDFLLELNPPDLNVEPSRASYDKRAASWKYWIQVKSTDGRPGSRSVKLDNWERLVKTPYPAFFLVCEFDGEDTCQRAYLVHVDEEYIRRTLIRLRELSLKPDIELHKTNQYFTYTEANRLPSLDGHGLLSTIQALIHSNANEYSSYKLHLIDTVGYENEGHSVTFRFIVPDEWANDPWSYWVDFTLGLIPGIDTQHVEIRDTRFGIDVPALAQTFQGGRLEIQRTPVREAHLVFSSEATRRQLRIPVNVYAPQGIPIDVKTNYRKWRFEADLIDITTNAKNDQFEGNLSFRFPPPTRPYSLSSLYTVASLCLTLFDSMQKNSRVTFEIWIGPQRLDLGQIDPVRFADLFDEHTLKLSMAIINAVAIAKHLDIPLNTLIKTAELYLQADAIQFQSDLLAGRTGSHLRVDFQVTEIEEGLPTCFPILFQTVIGEHKVIIAAAVLGQSEVLDSLGQGGPYRMQLTTNEPVYKQSWVDVRDGIPKQAMKGMLQSILDEYSDSHTVIVIEEYQSLLDL